jgi:hypothetical protein
VRDVVGAALAGARSRFVNGDVVADGGWTAW